MSVWKVPEFETIRYEETDDGVAVVTTSQESIAEGQQLFASGTRVEWKLR